MRTQRVPQGFSNVQVPGFGQFYALKCNNCDWTSSTYQPGFYDHVIIQAQKHRAEHRGGAE